MLKLFGSTVIKSLNEQVNWRTDLTKQGLSVFFMTGEDLSKSPGDTYGREKNSGTMATVEKKIMREYTVQRRWKEYSFYTYIWSNLANFF
jgi:hypothetical protein